MKFMLMMNAPRGDGDWGVANWSPEDFQAHIDFMMRVNRELSEAGELVGAEGLAPPGEARQVRAGENGAPEVTDGPFAEAKELLAGYWIVDVENPEQAYAIAARAGPGGELTPLAEQDRARAGAQLPGDEGGAVGDLGRPARYFDRRKHHLSKRGPAPRSAMNPLERCARHRGRNAPPCPPARAGSVDHASAAATPPDRVLRI